MRWPDTARRPRKSKNSAAFWMRIKETMMARLDSWLSPDALHALGWALLHALWQGLALAALAAVAMAFSRRPPVRYGIAVSALALMLAAPLATFFVLMEPVPVEEARISVPAVPPMA